MVNTKEIFESLKEGESFVHTLLNEPKYKKARNLYLGYKAVRPVAIKLKEFYKKLHQDVTYTFRVEHESPLHKHLCRWMEDHLQPTQINTFDVNTVFGPPEELNIDKEDQDCTDDNNHKIQKIRKSIPTYTFSLETPKNMYYNGVEIDISPKGDPEDGIEDVPSDHVRIKKPPFSFYTDIYLSANGIQGKTAIEDLFHEITDGITHKMGIRGRGDLYTLRKGGDWIRRGKIPNRSFANVFLPHDIQNALVEDMRNFLNLRKSYEHLGLPYHRGYLLYGPPGTGKTSVAQALANEFNSDLYCMSISDIPSDLALVDTFHNINSLTSSIILIEDIDVVYMTGARGNRSNEEKGVTLSGLLNVLDGVNSTEGTIVLMTTNDEPGEDGKFQRLDSALVRPGRADFISKIDYINEEQYIGFFRLFYGEDPITPFGELDMEEVPPVNVLECFKRYPLDMAKANEYLLSQFRKGVSKSEREAIIVHSGISSLPSSNRYNYSSPCPSPSLDDYDYDYET